MNKSIIAGIDLETIESALLHAARRIAGPGSTPMEQVEYGTLIDRATAIVQATSDNLEPATKPVSILDLDQRRRDGRLIRESRRLKRISQAELAAKIGINQSQISQVEAGTMTMAPDRLELACAVLGIAVPGGSVSDAEIDQRLAEDMMDMMP
jgi:ribosome-binding protein aMBF1 (putative translation factor)